MSRKDLKRKIFEYDFALYELSLFLDTHPTNKKAMELLEEYRAKRLEFVRMYEEKYGPFIMTHKDVPTGNCWKWLSSPWPWDNDFMEE